MIKIILSIFLLGNTLSIFGQSNSTKTLIGKWEGIDNGSGRTGKFNFMDSKRIEITYPDGSVGIGTYTIDFKKDPVWFDIINSNGSKTLKGLIKIENDSTFKWYLSRDGNRPIDYSQPIMVFRKT
jgi:hypothetical protein